MEKVWKDKLNDEIEKPYMQQLRAFLDQERAEGKTIYPPEEEVFSAFQDCPYDKLKVVLVGQDPYHGPSQAHGLSFSVKEGIKPPPSLVNIYKELYEDLSITPVTHGCLTPWAEQGVLLLNATLTVREKQPKSHYGKGWEVFTDFVIELLKNRKDPLVFILWGKSAEEKCKRLLTEKTPHLVLTAPHPSPFSAYKGFFGCKHFSKANSFLKEVGKEPIDWQLPMNKKS